ncbi:hypothetical protein MN116_008206 [Schistosoma mekongi]|uniref:Coiled-coil domain-containing protein n=1 Tax=Schistosoma mekongi TaxID=38744 RepID=A0AAE1Z6G5_SCHME|nr:hypothetical protein MN116_008206 [Schistosoma mekongi]
MAYKSRHHIEVSSVALVDLKAEISRRQIEIKQKVEKHPDGCNVIRNHCAELKPGKVSLWKTSKEQIIEERARLESKDVPSDSEEYIEWQKSKRALEAKAKLYDALREAAMSGKKTSLSKRDENNDDDILVDFEKKAIENINMDPPDSPARSCSSYSGDEDSNHYPAGCSDEEWEDYTDERGIKRVCMRKDLSSHMKQSSPPKPDGPLTYAHLREGEIRDHGVGFYSFSADPEQREAEMNRLRELHRATEEGRARAEAIRAKRDAKMGQRLARLRARKGLPDVATAAAQCLGDAAVAATPTPLGADAQSDIRLSNDDLDVASMLRRLRDEAEHRASINNKLNESTNSISSAPVSEQRRTNLADVLASQDPSRPSYASKQREWDKGKSMISAQRYIQEERDKRISDFAPPSHY